MKQVCALLFLLFCLNYSSSGEVKGNNAISIKAPQIAALHSFNNIMVPFNVFEDTIVHHRKHKLIAALLAFPLGIFGLHRIYLGTSAGVPFAYIATLGGGFGILPFVDFVLILLCKDVNTYAHNPSLFMWTRKKHHT